MSAEDGDGDDEATAKLVALLKALATTRRVREDNVPVAVIPGLYLGSVGAARNATALKKLNVTHVLTVMVEAQVQLPGLKYMTISVLDAITEPISDHFDRACEFIEEGRSKGNVFIHCFAGRSRSVAIVTAYLIKHERMTLKDALTTVRKVRHTAQPNPSFMLQLEDYEQRCSRSVINPV
eukprot:jgi/Chlat1/2557/Chrsp175S02440